MRKFLRRFSRTQFLLIFFIPFGVWGFCYNGWLGLITSIVGYSLCCWLEPHQKLSVEKIFPPTRQGDCPLSNFGACRGGGLLLLRLARFNRFNRGLACRRNYLSAIYQMKNFPLHSRGIFFALKNFPQVVDQTSNVI